MSKSAPEMTDNEIGRAVAEWLRRQSPPPTRDHADGFVRYRAGSIDPDSPFEDRLISAIETIRSQLKRLGTPSDLLPDWRAVQTWAQSRSVSVRDHVYALTLAGAWAEDALGERDPNRRSHKIFQAACELTALRARYAHGDTVATFKQRQARKRVIADQTNQKKRARGRLDARHALMASVVKSKGISAAARLAHEKGLAPSKKAAEESWRKARDTRRNSPSR